MKKVWRKLVKLVKLAIAASLVTVCAVVATSCASSDTPAMVTPKRVTSRVNAWRPPRALDYEVVLVPVLHGATAGWCITIVGAKRSECEVPPTSTGPIIVQHCHSASDGIEWYALTNKEVKAVSIGDGPVIETHRESSLPGGLRAVVVEIASQMGPQNRALCPRVTPLGAGGRRLHRSTKLDRRLERALPSRRSWELPARPSNGVCAIGTAGLEGYVAHWGSVVTQVRAVRGLIGHPFISCASAEYFSPNETSMTAAVLVNGARPGIPPAQLPDAKHLPGDLDIVRAPGSGGFLFAKRVPGGWVVVEEGGTGLEEPITLLEHLTAKIDLRPSWRTRG